ncbi:hypothetical protein PGTUg99_035720 [Puccinia graminis f. sp. tritici]|uniref:Uncharacterized protein n=2 Tax=Puccinia graminis f. sp. tritici TaxID=56615 RepID=H6QQ92_PUCGT|nr:uncharacterized protein PGTG_21038 [Puccinia graminis f. sp. tritici CRL 75-36-700-3]EHS64778.1 hypothetical protein PGTG_21038 [Puccinia graminis f. sp. tritici CRL 75-36-700-3]KAA1109844.1 hypothetical protein PGTUg99_035720 [Puccinia graminis f. sp. tritici]
MPIHSYTVKSSHSQLPSTTPINPATPSCPRPSSPAIDHPRTQLGESSNRVHLLSIANNTLASSSAASLVSEESTKHFDTQDSAVALTSSLSSQPLR